jgi:DNA-binding NtrC family response regulator
MARIGVVDDKELLRDSLAETLVREDHQVATFGDPLEALEAIKSQPFDLVVSDLKMPGLDGIGLLRELRNAGCELPVILMTAYGTVPTAVEAMKLGAFDYIQKPFEPEQLCVLVDRAVQHGRMQAENEALRRSLSDIHAGRVLVGTSPVMQSIRETIQHVAASQATVLVQGESGTGKELIARAIHAASPRADQPLLCLNCAALSAHLLESELFGHERGAFTGADRLRRGRFELADGGTLMLDEVSEISLALQAKLLRVLQERQFERVGSSVTREVDVRVIATTNRNLREWVARKRFREDLFFRLSVLPVEVPPLREHRDDIPDLVSYFLAAAAKRDGREPLIVEPSATELLRSYDWPGNVRELQNVCERACVLVRGGCVRAETIRPWLNGFAKEEASPPATGGVLVQPGRPLAEVERDLIMRTLDEYGGHRLKTAKALGIGVRTLGMKLKRWQEEARLECAGKTGRIMAAGASGRVYPGRAEHRGEPAPRDEDHGDKPRGSLRRRYCAAGATTASDDGPNSPV